MLRVGEERSEQEVQENMKIVDKRRYVRKESISTESLVGQERRATHPRYLILLILLFSAS